ncbi:MAG: hypothetical protein RR266_02275 [Bacilli bacterium]
MKMKIKFVLGLCLPLLLSSCNGYILSSETSTSTSTTTTSTSSTTTSTTTTVPTTVPTTTTIDGDGNIIADGKNATLRKEETYWKVKSNGGVNTLDPVNAQDNILVIPVAVNDFLGNATPKKLEEIKLTFSGDSTNTSWESVSSFYKKSSYGACNLNFTITDWYTPNMNPKQISAANNGESGGANDGGTWSLLDKAVNWYKSNNPNVDMKKYDNDTDGFIDGVWLIYSCPNSSKFDYSRPKYNIPENSNGYWAFTFWNFKNSEKANVASPVPYLYAWASYDFMEEAFGEGDKDAHTYIHETGHMLGLDDYYDASGNGAPYHPMGDIDMMDWNIGDHNSFTKYALGRITPTLINSTATVKLSSLADTGASILLKPENYNNTPFDEYFMISLITPTNLNKQDYTIPYPPRDIGYTTPGIMITHIDARGIRYSSSGSTLFEDNISKMEGTYGNNSEHVVNKGLICIFPQNYNSVSNSARNPFSITFSSNNDVLFRAGQSFNLNEDSKFRKLMPSKTNKLNDDTTFNYSVAIESITAGVATIKITK